MIERRRGCMFCGHQTYSPDKVCGSPRCQLLRERPIYHPEPILPNAPGRRVVIVYPKGRIHG